MRLLFVGVLFLAISAATAAKAITGTRSDGTNRATPIEAILHSDAATLIHGAQAEFGWSMVISEEGKMTLTVSGDRQGFIVFGACTVP